MDKQFKIRLKIGETEIEVESTEKKFVTDKIEEFKKSLSDRTNTKKKVKGAKKKVSKTVKSKNDDDSGDDDNKDLIIDIVNYIKESDKFPAIEEYVLNKKSQLYRVMMCLFFVEDAIGISRLSTGQIEKITDQFDVKIRFSDAAASIKKHSKYFAQDRARIRGAKIKYKLNRQGKLAFEKVLSGVEI